MWLSLLLATVAGYLLGSIPTGFLVGRAHGVDIRQWGSGATGGTNVLRTLGTRAAVMTGVVDVAKGASGALLGFWLAGDWGYALGAAAASLGHSYPVWLRFKGGKSVATGGGGLLPFHPWALLIAVVAGLSAIARTRFVSLGSLVATAAAALVVWLGGAPLAHKLYLAALAVVIYVRHWENIKRLGAGTETKFGQKAQHRMEP